MKRYGSVVELKEESIEKYNQLHVDVWPDVLAMNKQCHFQNYSIFLRKFPDGKHYLFSYLEYTGSDFEADMKVMAADPATQEWWDVCKPCHRPFADRAEGEWWASMEEVFHQD